MKEVNPTGIIIEIFLRSTMVKMSMSLKFITVAFVFISVFCLITPSSLHAQEEKSHLNIAIVKLVEGDTLYVMNLGEIVVTGKAPRKIKAKLRKRNKLERNIKKVYPYAKLAAVKMIEYEQLVLQAKNESERKELMKQAEEDLREEFEDEIVDFTFKQGILLIKLIDRETGDTSYEIIQEFRGKFMAFFWQTFARLFGYNLKVEYDPYGDDKEIEEIVLMIVRGEL